MKNPNCPGCAKPLQKVKQSPNSMLNAEQFDAARAGDWFCETCPGNGQARTGYRYFWDKDLTNTTHTPGIDLDKPCPYCGVDRLKAPCPRMADECAMIGDAHLLAQPRVTAGDEQALFEAWAELTDYQKRGAEHEVVGWYYFDEVTNDRWDAWQARAALTQQSAPEAPTDAEIIDVLWDSSGRFWKPDPLPTATDRVGYVYEYRQLIAAFRTLLSRAAPEAPITREMVLAEIRGAQAELDKFKAPVTQQAGSPSEQQSDEEAYAQSGYRHFMSLEKFRDFRAGVIPASPAASLQFAKGEHIAAATASTSWVSQAPLGSAQLSALVDMYRKGAVLEDVFQRAAALARAPLPDQGGAPMLWFDPEAVERSRLTDYADSITISGTSVKFGHNTAPLYAAPAQAGDARDAARWRFMMAVADSLYGPEGLAMMEFARVADDDDPRPESAQMIEIVDKARAAIAASAAEQKGPQ